MWLGINKLPSTAAHIHRKSMESTRTNHEPNLNIEPGIQKEHVFTFHKPFFQWWSPCFVNLFRFLTDSNSSKWSPCKITRPHSFWVKKQLPEHPKNMYRFVLNSFLYIFIVYMIFILHNILFFEDPSIIYPVSIPQKQILLKCRSCLILRKLSFRRKARSLDLRT